MKKEKESHPNAPGRALLEILVALSQGDSSAAALLEAMDHWPGGRTLPLGSFYRHLERGVNEGWIETAELLPLARRGRPSRHYRITDSGRRAAGAALVRMERLADLAQAAGFLSEEAR